MQVIETKISALPVLEPLSNATQTTLSPVDFLDSDFLELDVILEESGKMHFIAETVCLRKCPANMLPSDEVVYVQTPQGAYYKDDNYYHYPSNNASMYWFKKIPERSQKGFGKWRLAGTDFTALVIHHVWPHHKIIFKSEEAILLYTYLLKRFLLQSKNAVIAAEYSLTKQSPTMPKDFIEHPKLPLTPYQKVALLTCLNQEAYALFMEQGTGKTPIVINRICLEGARKRAKKEGMYRALILCPQQVRSNWEREFERFSTVPGKTSILRGGKLNRIKAFIEGITSEDDCVWSACIISMDSVNGTWEAFEKMKWDLVVIDESYRIKNPNTDRFKTLLKIDSLRTKFKMILTGTPITNTIFDLWSQLEWLGDGLSGFSTYSNFKAFHGRWEQKVSKTGLGFGISKLIGFQNVPLIQERLARLAFLIKKSEANLNLPDKVYDLYEISMGAKQAEIYKKVATKLVVEIDAELAEAEAEGRHITVDHILTKLLRLAQICSGFIKVDNEVDFENDEVQIQQGKIYQISEHNLKIEALIELIKEDLENDPNSKIIVWATFIEDLRIISLKLAEASINHIGYHSVIQSDYRVKGAAEAEVIINKNKECKVLVANPASAGVGLNFLGYDVDKPEEYSTYVNHEIYFSCNWSSVNRIQSEDRAHRRGTRTNVRITDLIIPRTIDEEIRSRVNDKRKMAITIQDIRNILRDVLQNYKD